MSKERNYGIDLVKIVAMFLIVLSHLLAHGGVIAAAEGTDHYYFITALNVLLFWPVNAYALSTGAVGYNGRHGFSRLVNLYLETLFYSAGISVVLFLVGKCSLSELLKGFFPLISGQYWYFTAYFFLFFLMPYLDKLLNSVNNFRLAIILIGLCTINALSISGNIFYWNYGLSGSWLCILYLFGALLTKYKVAERVSAKTLLVVLAVSLSVSYLGYLIVPELAMRYAGIHYGTYQFLKFTAPTVLLSGGAIMLLFCKVKIKSELMRKAIKTISPLTFGVYLIHENGLFVNAIYRDKFAGLLEQGNLYMLGVVLLLCIALFMFSLVIDYLRSKLFVILRIDLFSKKLASLGNSLYRKLSKMVSGCFSAYSTDC